MNKLNKFKSILKIASLKLILTLSPLFLPILLHAQAPGMWTGSSIQTTTLNSLGVGTNTPDGWLEIEYCNSNENGLIITKKNCPLNVLLPNASMDGEMLLNLGQEIGETEPTGGYGYLTNFTVPINFSLKRNNMIFNKPIIWGRTENSTMFTNASGTYTTRFIVTPTGLIGSNVEVPRAPLDIKLLGAYNSPAAIFGKQALNTADRTRHLMVVPLLYENGYNQITQTKDLGMFFTDGLGQDGANMNGALVIAPWAANRNPSIGGIRINANGNVDIHGELKCTKMTVQTQWWSDFVFNKNYKLLTLPEVEGYINENGHLPDVPSEKTLKESGIDIAQMQAIHIQKIEELTLYAIEQEKKLQEQKNILLKQQKEIEALKSMIEEIKNK